jgi:hypothetical protein
MAVSAENKVLGLVTKAGILLPRDLQKTELPPDYLCRLHKKGQTRKGWKGNVRPWQRQSYRTPNPYPGQLSRTTWRRLLSFTSPLS